MVKNIKLMNIYRYLFLLPLLSLALSIEAQNIIVATDTTKIPEVTLGEVSVSASRTNLRVKELPASVSMLSSYAIEANEISSLTDVTGAAPNFFMPDYGSKLTSPVYIRGIGSRINAPSVGLYVDNVPYFDRAAFNFDFFDIERIEILRGPHGTLYGRNTMGGIINIVTPSPFTTSGGKVSFTAGNYGYLNGTASYYGKAGENLGYSLAFNYLHKDGYYENQFTGDNVDKSDSYGFRNKLIWKPTSRLSIENVLNGEHSRQGGYPYALFNPSTGMAEEISYNQYSYYNRKMLSDAIVVQYHGDKNELRAVTSYQYLDDYQSIDQDFTVDSLYYVTQVQKQHMISQEITLRSLEKSRYHYLFGLYGFRQIFDKEVDVDVWSSDMRMLKDYDHTIGGYAIFHQSTLNNFLTEGLSLTAGIRFDWEKDELVYRYDREMGGSLTPLEDTLYPSLDYFEIMPKISLSYEAGKNSFYITASRGYKGGGFNSTFERPEDLNFDPEYSWNYEVGSKGSMWARKIYYEVALFYIDWKDQQIYQTVPSGRGSMLKNAGHSASKGFELTLKAIPLYGFENSLSYGYTHATFLSHVVDDATDHSGNFIPYVPRHTISVQTNKVHYINEGYFVDRISFNIAYRGVGEIFWKEDNQHSQDYYGVVDLKATFSRRNIGLDFWVKNLFNSSFESFYFTALGNEYVQMGKPVNFGTRLLIKF